MNDEIIINHQPACDAMWPDGEPDFMRPLKDRKPFFSKANNKAECVKNKLFDLAKKESKMDFKKIGIGVAVVMVLALIGYGVLHSDNQEPQTAQATPVDAPAGPLKAIDRYYEGMNSGEIGKCLGDFCSHKDKIAKGMCVLGAQEMSKIVKNEQDIEDTERMHDPMGMTGTEKKVTAVQLKETVKTNTLPKMVNMGKGGF